MNGENTVPAGRQEPIGPAPLPDNTPPPTGGTPPPPPGPPAGGPPAGPPPPPPPQIDIRTMASDKESLERSGGLGTEPKTFSPADLAKEPVFDVSTVSPATGKAGTGGKQIGIAVGAIAILALAGAIGYYLVWPLFSGEESQVTEVTPPTTTPTQPTSPPSTYQSFFTKPAATTREINLDSLTLAELSTALRKEEAMPGTIKEINLKVDNAPVTSSALLNLLIPGTGLESMLESGVTSFIYYDAKGAWPGYVFKLKSGNSAATAETSAAKIEQSADLAALYLANPGTKSGTGFKNGSILGIKTRYQSFSGGASLNYGWIDNNHLVISTSFDGFKKVIELLPSD